MIIKVRLDALPPVPFIAPRYDAAGVVLFGYGLLTVRDWRPRGRDGWLAIFINGAPLIGAHFPLLFSGQRYVTSGVSAIAISLTSALTPLFTWPMLSEERLDAFDFLGVSLGLAGTVVIALVSGSIDNQFFGVPLLSLAAMVWAFGSVLVKRLPNNPPVVPMQSWMVLTDAVIPHVTDPVLGEPGLVSAAQTPVVAAALLFLVVLCSAVSLITYFVLFDRISAVEISLVNYVTPVVAAVTGWAFLGEHLGLVTVAGSALTLTGLTSMKRDVFGPLGRRFDIRAGLVAPAPAADLDGPPADD